MCARPLIINSLTACGSIVQVKLHTSVSPCPAEHRRESFRCFWPAVFMEESTANQSKLWPRGHLSSFFWPDLGAGLLCKVLIFILHHCKADLKPAIPSYNTLRRWRRYYRQDGRKNMQTASWGLFKLFAKQEKQLLTLSLFRAHWYFQRLNLLWDRKDTWLDYIHFPYTW